MSKNVAIFVDVANLYYSARGQDVDVDYVALLKAATKGRDLVRAYAYSGLDPENENQRKFIDFLGKNGYKVVHKDIRKFGDGRVKANLDIELVVDLFRVKDRMDIAVIVSGDGDFAPAIRALQDVGIRCEVISFRPNTSSDLIAVADEFIDIMKIASIGRDKAAATKGMSAPPMPAKEVEPEFGFRDASPAVAAAAMAAIRGGGDRSRSRTRGTSTSRRAEAAPTEDLVTAAPTAAPSEPHADGQGTHDEQKDGARRRRRRGGRGRGRRAHAEGESSTAGAASGEEIAWQELDDLSQVDLGEEREYSFEEADAETLAELGLLDQGGMATPEQALEPTPDEMQDGGSAEAAPKPRRSRSRKASAPAETPDSAPDASAVTPEAQTVSEEKPKRRTRSRAAATDEAAKPKRTRARTSRESAGEEAPKPKPRASRSRGGSSAAVSETKEAGSGEPAEGEPQGIWGRFRSARNPR